MNYREMQKRATELGIPANGTQEELSKRIQEEEARLDETDERDSVDEESIDERVDQEDTASTTSEEDSQPVNEEESQKDTDFNTAFVMDGTREVRRYTKMIHKNKFVELAQMFAQKHGYSVKLGDTDVGIVCPACGHRFIV